MTQRLPRETHKASETTAERETRLMPVRGMVNGVPLEELPLEKQMEIRRRIGASFQAMCRDIAEKQVAEEFARAQHAGVV